MYSYLYAKFNYTFQEQRCRNTTQLHTTTIKVDTQLTLHLWTQDQTNASLSASSEKQPGPKGHLSEASAAKRHNIYTEMISMFNI